MSSALIPSRYEIEVFNLLQMWKQMTKEIEAAIALLEQIEKAKFK